MTIPGEGGYRQLTADPDYARQIFDDMAPVFEHKLVQDLGYKCPWTMREALDGLLAEGLVRVGVCPKKQPVEEPTEHSLVDGVGGNCVFDKGNDGDYVSGGCRVIDLGCGSGLCGRVFQTLVFPGSSPPVPTAPEAPISLQQAVNSPGPCMIGIDVSSRMVELTLRNGGYSFAVKDDLRQALRTCVSVVEAASAMTSSDVSRECSSGLAMDMIIAADTFLYVGCLGEILYLSHRALAAGGLLMFSTECLDQSPMRRTAATTDAPDPERTSPDQTGGAQVCL